MSASIFFVRFKRALDDAPIASAHMLAFGPMSAVSAARKHLAGRVDLDGARVHVSSGYALETDEGAQDDDPFFGEIIGGQRAAVRIYLGGSMAA